MTMRFCPECNNLLHPREERPRDRALNPDLSEAPQGKKRLIYACRRCRHTELANNPVIYRDEIKHSSAEKTLIEIDVTADPTLPRTQRNCPKCGHTEAIFFQSQNWTQDTGVMLFFVCTNTNCGHRWTDA